MKGKSYFNVRFFRHAKWNKTTCYWLGQRRTKDGSNNSAYLCLLLIIQFLSRLCNIFSARSIALKECYLMMNSEKNSFYCSVTYIFFFRKCVPLVVSKVYTKFQLLSLPSSNILESIYFITDH